MAISYIEGRPDPQPTTGCQRFWGLTCFFSVFLFDHARYNRNVLWCVITKSLWMCYTLNSVNANDQHWKSTNIKLKIIFPSWLLTVFRCIGKTLLCYTGWGPRPIVGMSRASFDRTCLDLKSSLAEFYAFNFFWVHKRVFPDFVSFKPSLACVLQTFCCFNFFQPFLCVRNPSH